MDCFGQFCYPYTFTAEKVEDGDTKEDTEEGKKKKSISESTKELQMDEMRVMFDVESEDEVTLSTPAVVESLPSQDYVSEAISM